MNQFIYTVNTSPLYSLTLVPIDDLVLDLLVPFTYKLAYLCMCQTQLYHCLHALQP